MKPATERPRDLSRRLVLKALPDVRLPGFSVSFCSAYWRGARAFIEGAPRTACPYPDHRTDRGSVTFSRGYRTAWRDGWDAAEYARRPAGPFPSRVGAEFSERMRKDSVLAEGDQ